MRIKILSACSLLLAACLIMGLARDKVHAQNSSEKPVRIPDLIQFQNSKNCVAWKTKKRMFLVQTKEAAGVNCDISAEFKQSDEGKLLISVSIPINKFDSGEKERDQEVLKILGAETRPRILFSTEISSELVVEKLAQKKTVEIPGTLRIKSKDHDVIFKVSKPSESQYVGKLEGSFSQFSIDPPSVAGGFVAKVYDELDLYFRMENVDVASN